MAYDRDRKVTVLFGGDVSGSAADTWFNDTWEYDGKQWTQITIDGAIPPRRSNHAMAYDEARKVMVMSGGENVDGYLDDTWSYSGTGNGHGIWTPSSPMPNGLLPTGARSGHTITYDEDLQMCVLIGGAVKIDDNNGVAQEWTRAEVMVWDGVGWNAHPGGGTLPALGFSPTERINGLARHAAAYDSDEHRIVFYDGWEGCYMIGSGCNPDLDLPPSQREPFPSQWVVGFVNGKLRQVISFDDRIRDTRESGAMVYDRLRHRFVIYGGYDRDLPQQYESYQELAHTGDTNTPYFRTEIPIDTGLVSGNVTRLAMVYDLHRGVVVWFGGAYGLNRLDQTWELNGIRAEFLQQPPPTQTVCEGTPVEFQVTLVPVNQGIVGQALQWKKDGQAIPGATTNVLRIEAASVDDDGVYNCTVSDRCGNQRPSFDSRLIVNTNPRITAYDASRRERCPGESVTFAVAATSTLPLRYQWRKNLVAIEGATDSQLTLANLAHADTGEYDVLVMNDCSTVQSAQAHLQVGVTILAQPLDALGQVCQSAAFQVQADGVGTLSYQWRLEGLPLSGPPYFYGANTPQLSVQPLLYAHEGRYDVIVTDNCGPLNAVTSSVARLRINPGPQWVLRTTNGPPARYGDALAYDSARGVTVLYGGGQVVPAVGYVGFGEVWEWDGTRWMQRTTYNPSSAWTQDTRGYWVPSYGDTPAARLQHAIAYDSRRGRVVMFGGRGTGLGGGDYAFNDTWEWDGTRWYFRATNGPPAQFDHHMAYDPGRGVTVLYGGFGASPAQVWEWDGTSWRSVSPVHGPVTSYYQTPGSMDYDSSIGQVFFGPSEDGFAVRSFWSWDGQDWHEQGQGFLLNGYAPPQGAMAFDSFRNHSIYFGGQNAGFNNDHGGSSGAVHDFAGRSFPPGWSQVPDAAQASTFVPEDFLGLPALVAKLVARIDPVSQYLWAQFAGATQLVLTAPGSTPGEQASALADALNSIITQNILYDPVRFAGVVLSTETVVCQSVNPIGSDLVRLNRLLLEDAYPLEIRRSRSTPTGRYYHAMTFDSRRHAVVLMGGLYSFPSLAGNATWELHYIENPVITEQPSSQYRAPGDTALFRVAAAGPFGSLQRYAWFFGSQPLADGGRVSGAHTATLQIANLNASDAGQYNARVSDDCGSTDSFAALLTLDPSLQIFTAANAPTLVWGAPNVVLQQADSISGPWNAVPGAASPFDVVAQGPGKFFRIVPAPGP